MMMKNQALHMCMCTCACLTFKAIAAAASPCFCGCSKPDDAWALGFTCGAHAAPCSHCESQVRELKEVYSWLSEETALKALELCKWK